MAASSPPLASVPPSGANAGGERRLGRTEGGGLPCGGMRLPGPVQRFPVVPPHACSSAPAAHSPVVAIGACGYRPGRVKGLGKDRLLQGSPGKCRILHLDPLEIGTSKRELRQIQATQVSAKLSQQRKEIRWSIPLSVVSPFALLDDQREQLLLERG